MSYQREKAVKGKLNPTQKCARKCGVIGPAFSPRVLMPKFLERNAIEGDSPVGVKLKMSRYPE